MLYETAADRARERDVGAIIADYTGEVMWSTDTTCPFDFYGCTPPRIVAVYEIKNRFIPSTKYETVFLETQKARALIEEAERFDAAPFFVVSWTDVVGMVDVREAVEFEVGWATRPARGDAPDPAHLVPVRRFEVLAKY